MVKKVAIVFYVIGILLTLTLAVIGVWPEFEAIFFDITIPADESLTTLRCPMVITPGDEATISASFTNPREKPINLFVKAHISQNYLTMLRESNHELNLNEGETEELKWAVPADDAVYDRFVFARVHSLRTSGIPSRQKACGILVLNVPGLSGNQIIIGLLLGSILFLGFGAFLWLQTVMPLSERDKQITIGLGIILVMVVLSSITSLLGLWIVSAVLFFFVLLVCVAMLEHYLS